MADIEANSVILIRVLKCMACSKLINQRPNKNGGHDKLEKCPHCGNTSGPFNCLRTYLDSIK